MRVRIKKIDVNQKYIVYLLQSQQIQSGIDDKATGVALKNMFATSELKQFEIPLPPLEVQKEIVAEIDGYQKVINGARAVLDHYRPHISIHPDWPIIELGKVCKIKGGYAFKSSDFMEKSIQLIRMGNVKRMLFDHQNSPVFLPNSFKNDYRSYILKKGDILISMTGTIGKEDYGNVCMIDIEGDFLLNQRVGKFEIDTSKLNPSFIYYVAQSAQFRSSLFSNSSGGVRQANISNKGIEQVKIPLPSLATQQQIVAEIEAEQALVAANRELIARFEKKIQATLARVWGEENQIATEPEQ
jgi:type I restriction enzyme M protein